MAGLAVIAVSAVAAPGAQAFKRVGSNLAGEPDAAVCPPVPPGVPHSCTESIASLAPANAAPAGAIVPSDGVVTVWRIKRGAGDAFAVETALRVIRGTTGAGTSAEVTLPAGAGTYEFPTRLPVAAGDQIGVDLRGLPTDFPVTIARVTGVNDDVYNEWTTPLTDGASAPPQARPRRELLINADVEADADRDGFGDETQDACPTIPTTQRACTVGAPETKITKKPKKKSRKTNASVKFTSSLPGASFLCSLDGVAYEPCTSPWKVKKLSKGEHFILVQAVVNQIPDPTPAQAKFTVKKKKRKPRN